MSIYISPLSKCVTVNVVSSLLKDVNPVCSFEDLDQRSSDNVGIDPPQSFLLCISENWDKQQKQLTVGLVVSLCSMCLCNVDFKRKKVNRVRGRWL